MAQHISIINSKMKNMQKIADGIRTKVLQGIWGVSGSLKFEELVSKEHKINSDDRVFVTKRIINGKREIFELHYDTKAKKILDIFLVS